MNPLEWIFDHPQVIILVVGAVAWLFNQKQQAAARKTQEEEQWPGDNGEMVDWGEPTKPLSGTPPPLIFGTPPPLAPQVDQSAAELERQRSLAERLRTIRAAREEQARPKVPVPVKIAAAPSRLGARLRNRAELRAAIVMKEILGPPAGLR